MNLWKKIGHSWRIYASLVGKGVSTSTLQIHNTFSQCIYVLSLHSFTHTPWFNGSHGCNAFVLCYHTQGYDPKYRNHMCLHLYHVTLASCVMFAASILSHHVHLSSALIEALSLICCMHTCNLLVRIQWLSHNHNSDNIYSSVCCSIVFPNQLHAHCGS